MNNKIQIFGIKRFAILLIVGLPIFVVTSCEKLIEIDPPIDQQVGKSVFETDLSAASVLTGIYTTLSSSGGGRPADLSIYTGLSSDELVTIAPEGDVKNALYTNGLFNEGTQLFWTSFYHYIFRTNSAIEGISSSPTITPIVKQRLIGEAKFIRAFMYFYLVNLYGRIPLLTTTDIEKNRSAERVEVSQVYNQIISDLLEAKESLSESYLGANITSTTSERIRPNKVVASALLARVYLYTRNWQKAEQEASEIIGRKGLYELTSLDSVFLTTSKEAIWQLQSSDEGINTIDARLLDLKPNGTFVLPGPDDGRPFYLNKNLYKAFSSNDNRLKKWVDSVTVNGTTYPFASKYKISNLNQPLTEHVMVLRLAEQYLIRAEARFKLGKNVGNESSVSDLNTIRKRAGLVELVNISVSEIEKQLLSERQRELFLEWGHRWLDLQRTGEINNVMSLVTPEKGGQWQTYKALYPLPIPDILNNPGFKGDQNPGYPAN